ncbi:hypothetical protein B9Z55_000742 [Caenorhabditis nigoni]|uniref:Radical SAM core domain-containing protein n=1 Tax=Caenorhabditis nigoni TaxID=1611254 RepID=A0A2G5VUV8_9PELO|nr:hypothetical protein B9Z55_000742 [Caenorhabditis nigoni]
MVLGSALIPQLQKFTKIDVSSVPNIYIATDMILAFPPETLEDFEESMELVRKYKFPSLFINQYYPRSGTPAARLKKIDTVEARKRTAAMSELFRSYTRFTEDRIGEIHNVLVTEIAAGREFSCEIRSKN